MEIYAIFIEDKKLKKDYLYMSAGRNAEQGRCFIYQSEEYAREARKWIGKIKDCNIVIRKIIIK